MTREELKQGKEIVITESIKKVSEWLKSYEAQLHRNIRKSQERRLEALKTALNKILRNEWSAEDEYTYNNLYANQPYDVKRISAL